MATWQRPDYVAMSLVCVSVFVLATGLVHEHNRLIELESRLLRVETRSVDRRPSPIEISGAAVKGSRSAPAALVVYSDFQCPYCRGFALTTLATIEREYVASGRLLVAFKHFPLERLHSSAIRAAEAASCANKQGRFWPMHDRIFTAQSIPDRALFTEWAVGVGLERNQFSDCLETHSDLLRIQRDAEEARNLGFTGTPAFVVGRLTGSVVAVRHRITGSRPLEDFTSAIDEVLHRTN